MKRKSKGARRGVALASGIIFLAAFTGCGDDGGGNKSLQPVDTAPATTTAPTANKPVPLGDFKPCPTGIDDTVDYFRVSGKLDPNASGVPFKVENVTDFANLILGDPGRACHMTAETVFHAVGIDPTTNLGQLLPNNPDYKAWVGLVRGNPDLRKKINDRIMENLKNNSSLEKLQVKPGDEYKFALVMVEENGEVFPANAPFEAPAEGITAFRYHRTYGDDFKSARNVVYEPTRGWYLLTAPIAGLPTIDKVKIGAQQQQEQQAPAGQQQAEQSQGAQQQAGPSGQAQQNNTGGTPSHNPSGPSTGTDCGGSCGTAGHTSPNCTSNCPGGATTPSTNCTSNCPSSNTTPGSACSSNCPSGTTTPAQVCTSNCPGSTTVPPSTAPPSTAPPSTAPPTTAPPTTTPVTKSPPKPVAPTVCAGDGDNRGC